MKQPQALDDCALVDSSELIKGIYEADPNFFSLFGAVGDNSLVAVLGELTSDSLSDLHNPIVARIDRNVLGFLHAYHFKEMFSRQARSLRRLVSLLDNPRELRPSLTELASSKGMIENENSYYLARIYVMPDVRGSKIGELLIRFYESRATSLGLSALSLHVRAENTRAQSFYARLGFKFTDVTTNGYYSMEKLINDAKS